MSYVWASFEVTGWLFFSFGLGAITAILGISDLSKKYINKKSLIIGFVILAICFFLTMQYYSRISYAFPYAVFISAGMAIVMFGVLTFLLTLLQVMESKWINSIVGCVGIFMAFSTHLNYFHNGIKGINHEYSYLLIPLWILWLLWCNFKVARKL